MEPNILKEIFEKRKADLKSMELYYDTLAESTTYRRKTIKQQIHLNQKNKTKSELFLITELKPKSPSKGVLIDSDEINPVAISVDMENSGSSAISVLTEPHYFGGSYAMLKLVTQTVKIPVLMKDFVFHPIQIRIAKKLGASNVLLITGYSDLDDLLRECKKLEVEPLIEIHNKEDIDIIIQYKDYIKEIGVIGINNRDLRTLSIDLNTSKRLVPELRNEFGKDTPIISESGFQNFSEIMEFHRLGVDGFLIGSSIMQSGNIGQKIRELRGVA